jgi:hypothetical protein
VRAALAPDAPVRRRPEQGVVALAASVWPRRSSAGAQWVALWLRASALDMGDAVGPATRLPMTVENGLPGR